MKRTDAHTAEPLDSFEAHLLRWARALPRPAARWVQHKVDNRRWLRWAKARSDRPVDDTWFSLLNRHLEMDHYSPTANGLRPCRSDCVVCATPIADPSPAQQ